jgi:3-methyladenine DNA glycosylase AlkC
MMQKNKEKFSLKDELFNRTKVERVAKEINAVYTRFYVEKFCDEVMDLFPKLELKERMYHMRDMFKKYLPDDYREATNILLKALPPELDTKKEDNDFGDFIYAPYSEYVVAYGCCDEHLDFSLHALREMTKRFSVEFAIRDFINEYPKETLSMLEQCALSGNYHERRLASEGLRPKLPWAKKLTLDYREAMQHLELLYDDETRYVTRSVANHMNDISKIDASLVIDTLKCWKNTKRQEPKEMDYIIRHSLRTLVKQGNEKALSFLGYKKHPQINVSDIVLDSTIVCIGDSLSFDIEIEAQEDVNLMVDYIIYFRTKRGTFSPKVYKLKNLVLQKGEKIKLRKKHLFKINMSTRTFYEGEHKLRIQINGKIVQAISFDFKEED